MSNKDTSLDIPDTGERLIPDTAHDNWNYQVHFSRYSYVEKYATSSSSILDYGCGTGYGIQHLAQFTQEHCVGVDKLESIEYAKSRYPKNNLQYLAGDLTTPEARYGKFDLIISFDVIEHVSDIDSYLENIAVQMRDESSLVFISTPWSFRRNNLFPLHNQHHVCEMTLSEFFAYLERHFWVEEILLNMGMMARLRRKGLRDNNLGSMSIPLSGNHLIALEEALEMLSQRVESLEVINQGVAEVSRLIEENQPTIDLSGFEQKQLNTSKYHLQPVSQNAILRLKILSEANNLSAIDLVLSNYGHLNGCNVHMSIYDKQAQVVSVILPALLIRDGVPQRFLFPPLPNSLNHEYEIVLESDGPPRSTIGIWCDEQQRPLLQLYYRRYRWPGPPQYHLQAEFVSEKNAFLESLSIAKFTWRRPFLRSLSSVNRLPPVEQRPWPANASLSTKLVGTLQYYGVVPLIFEMSSFVKWKLKEMIIERKG